VSAIELPSIYSQQALWLSVIGDFWVVMSLVRFCVSSHILYCGRGYCRWLIVLSQLDSALYLSCFYYFSFIHLISHQNKNNRVARYSVQSSNFSSLSSQSSPVKTEDSSPWCCVEFPWWTVLICRCLDCF